jgi:uncharacterized protein YciI
VSIDEARPDERHSGAQQIYFLCFTDPVALSPDEMRPYIDEHKAWLTKVEASGILFLAGPMLDDDFRFSGSGLMVLRSGSFSEARALLDTDPFHANGIRSYRLVPWQVNEGSIGVSVVLSTNAVSLT